MKPIQKDELFGHLTSFLKARGVELKDGAYTQSIQKGCSILADTINLSQQGIERAQTQIEKRLDQMRQVIHEKTAPKKEAKPSASKTKASKSKTKKKKSGKS
jgi:hypothetical protein